MLGVKRSADWISSACGLWRRFYHHRAGMISGRITSGTAPRATRHGKTSSRIAPPSAPLHSGILVPFQLFQTNNDTTQRSIELPTHHRIVMPDSWNGTRVTTGDFDRPRLGRRYCRVPSPSSSRMMRCASSAIFNRPLRCWGLHFDVRGPRSLVPLLDIERNSLPLPERIERLSLEGGPVKEELDAIVSLNEPKASFPDQPLDRACCHCFCSSPDVRPGPVAFFQHRPTTTLLVPILSPSASGPPSQDSFALASVACIVPLYHILPQQPALGTPASPTQRGRCPET